MRRWTRLGVVAAVAAVAAVAVACGGGNVVEIPELTAEPLPPPVIPEPAPPVQDGPSSDDIRHDPPDSRPADDADDESDDADPAPAVDETDDPDPAPEPSSPSDHDVGTFVSRPSADAHDADHVVGDLTGDGQRNVLLTILDSDGRLTVVIATWTRNRFEVAGEVTRDDVDRLGRTAVKDLTADGRREVLVPHHSGPRIGVLVATVGDDGTLTLPPSCPLAEPTTVGITVDAGSYELVFACDRSDTTGPAILVWDDDAFAGPAGPLDAPGQG